MLVPMFYTYVILWILVIVNIILTLRIIRMLRSGEEVLKSYSELNNVSELTLGSSAPSFAVEDLAGKLYSLSEFEGLATAFIFFSPNCAACRYKTPSMLKLSRLASRNGIGRIVLVSEVKKQETANWIKLLADEDKVIIDVPVLIGSHDFVFQYNPRRTHPYFCLISAQGEVISRGPHGSAAWENLEKQWSRTNHWS